MPTNTHTGSLERILAALRDVGDMTANELAAYLGITKSQAASLVNLACIATPRRPQRAHVCGWTTDAEGTSKPYPRPVYRFGPGEHVKKPKPRTVRERDKARREKMRKLNRSTSVFNLAAGYRRESLKHTGNE